MTQRFRNWLLSHMTPKYWTILFLLGVVVLSLCLGVIIGQVEASSLQDSLLIFAVATILSGGLIIISFRQLVKSLADSSSSYTASQSSILQDVAKRGRDISVVAIGGGTGLPATLRGLKSYTDNITAIVTVADDGGSSGRLRREMGILPPGDLRNNIAALADDESLMTRLFQYRFSVGELEGHSFGNLLIAALADLTVDENAEVQNSLTVALLETQRILNIKGRVLPATLTDVYLTAQIRLANSDRLIKVKGESQIEEVDGQVESIQLNPEDVPAHPPSVQAILDAELIVIGPGSLYTSILPNLMVPEIVAALRATDAYKIYVCNVATQPVETTNYTMADHVMAMEKHIGRGVFQAVLANNVYPSRNAGITRYVLPAPAHHEIHQRYEVRYTDLTDEERPWRHDSTKLAHAIMDLFKPQQAKGILIPTALSS